jgi:DNA-binding NarL/FixJ family response regulator
VAGLTVTIRVVIADDHPVFRDGLRALFAGAEDITLVGEAPDGAAVLDIVSATLPDIVVMDLQMPGLDGVEATRRLAALAPGSRVIVLTMFEDDASVFAAMRAGARGYLVKGADAAEILGAIRAVAAGEAVFGAALASRILGFFASPRAAGLLPFPELTDREHQILELIAQGLANEAIATRLGISPKTVRNQVSVILDKLEVVDRGAAIVRAREAGLGGEAGRSEGTGRGEGSGPH